jgi:hypothetical protein
MSVRPGNAQETVIATTALGANAGHNFSINNSAFAIIDAITLTYTSTATVGSRTALIQLLDPAGRLLWECVATTAIAPSQVVLLMAGAGVGQQNIVGPPIVQYMPLPSELAVPAQSTIQVSDFAHIDNADTVAGVISYAM